MKKTLCLVTAFVIIIAFASCSGNGTNDNASQDITSKNEISKTHSSTEDDVSVMDTSSKEDYTSQPPQSGIDNSYDASEPDDSSIVSETDNSSVVPEPDDSSVVSEPDDSSVVSEPNDSSAPSEPDTSIDIPPITANSSPADIFSAVSSNNNVLSLNTIMTSIIKNYLNGQDVLYIRSFSSGDSKLFDLEVTDTSVIDSAICVEPYEGPIEYCCYLIKLKDGADKDSIKAEFLSSMDKNRWGCITAEKAIVIDSGNILLAIMASEAETDAYAKAFESVMGSAGTVLYK